MMLTLLTLLVTYLCASNKVQEHKSCPHECDTHDDGIAVLQVCSSCEKAADSDWVCCNVQGRQHPVELLYAALPQDSYLDAALNTILQIHTEQEPGDVLVFLTGQEEIDSLQQLLKHRYADILMSGNHNPLAP